MTLVQQHGFKQTATYWGSPTPDGSGGNTYAAPVSLAVRWEENTEETFDASGAKFVSQAKVFCRQPVDVGGYLFLGTSVATHPTAVAKAYKIRAAVTTPALRNKDRAEWKAML
jgi:hypothetical protein